MSDFFDFVIEVLLEKPKYAFWLMVNGAVAGVMYFLTLAALDSQALASGEGVLAEVPSWSDAVALGVALGSLIPFNVALWWVLKR